LERGAVKPRWSGQQLEEKENTMSNSPAHRIRRGVLQVTIWRNTSDKGTFYSVTPSRGYKQGDDTWRETDSLNQDDILPMAKLLELSDTWIMHQQQADAKARKDQAKQHTAA
jgi:hypothetical protein